VVKIKKASGRVIKQAAKIIREGGVVAFPTETVYGLGASAFNPEAVARVFEIKKRPWFDPLIVHLSQVQDLKLLCRKIPSRVWPLIEKFWPGPLTLVLKKSQLVPEIVTAGLDTVAVRMPANQIALNLITEAGVPLAAPSANLFGRLSPTTARHVAEQIGKEVDLIIDGGRTRLGVESTVLDCQQELRLLRPGALPVEELEKVVGEIKIPSPGSRPTSPGQLPKHYAPSVPLKIVKTEEIVVPRGVKAGLLAFKSKKGQGPFKKVEVLSSSGDLREAAANLFAALHRLEKAGLDIIYAEPVPEEGLGMAIMDRLRKAEGLKSRKALY